MCACTCICACARVRVHAHKYACACMCMHMRRWRVLVVTPWRVWRCLGRAYAPTCMCMHVHAYMNGHVCAQPAVSVTCTLEQVFWALVNGRVCTYASQRVGYVIRYPRVYILYSRNIVGCGCVWHGNIAPDVLAFMHTAYNMGFYQQTDSLLHKHLIQACVCVHVCVYVCVYVYVCVCVCVYVCVSGGCV